MAGLEGLTRARALGASPHAFGVQVGLLASRARDCGLAVRRVAHYATPAKIGAHGASRTRMPPMGGGEV